MAKSQLAKAGNAAKRYRLARDIFYQSIKEAWDKGYGMIEIASIVGLSRQRVHQIVQAQEQNKEKQITGDNQTQTS